MPSFHTKTISTILDPVAQQVSQLVILHEEAEDGNAMPDLSAPIGNVGAAVKNLVTVGKDTAATSKDTILKQDMPPAFTRVEEAANWLIEASTMLKYDPYSSPARKKLIEGARGILNGTAHLLIVFDQAEVRKILKVCEGVMEYISVAEVVEVMEDLVTFVKNLSPGITSMVTQVERRANELTHQVHCNLLIKYVTDVKTLVPILVSAIKIFITTIQTNSIARPEAQENRNFVINKMMYNIREIMRILLLTTYDEDDWSMDDVTVMRKAKENMTNLMNRATDWLADPNAKAGGLGEGALRQILADAQKVADRVEGPHHDAIVQSINDITAMTDELAELRRNGQGNSPRAQQLAQAIRSRLAGLQKQVDSALQDTIKSGTGKPAHTIAGKMDQAHKWLSNPTVSDKGVGRKAIEFIIADGRKVAEGLTGAQKQELLQLCDDTEALLRRLNDLIAQGKGNSPEAQAIAQQLAEKLQRLQGMIETGLAHQVVDAFMDTVGPLKQLERAANAPIDEPNREPIYISKATFFLKHANRVADTAQLVAESGSSNNKNLIQDLNSTAEEVKDLAPQVVAAGKILLHMPENAAAREHFKNLKEEYLRHMNQLTGMVDEATDAVEFIKASEESIKKDSETVAQAISQRNPQSIVAFGGSIARKANRVYAVAEREAENSEDPEFVKNVRDANTNLEKSIGMSVRSAKNIALNPSDQNAQGEWISTKTKLLDDIAKVKRPLIVVIPPEQRQQPIIPASRQADLQQAPPPRQMYSADSPQHQGHGPQVTSPYGRVEPESYVKATPMQSTFSQPQYAASPYASDRSSPMHPRAPPFNQASAKTTAPFQHASPGSSDHSSDRPPPPPPFPDYDSSRARQVPSQDYIPSTAPTDWSQSPLDFPPPPPPLGARYQHKQATPTSQVTHAMTHDPALQSSPSHLPNARYQQASPAQATPLSQVTHAMPTMTHDPALQSSPSHLPSARYQQASPAQGAPSSRVSYTAPIMASDPPVQPPPSHLPGTSYKQVGPVQSEDFLDSLIPSYGPGAQYGSRSSSRKQDRGYHQPLSVETAPQQEMQNYNPLLQDRYDGTRASPRREILEDVGGVRKAFLLSQEPPLPPPPDISQLRISTEESAPPRPPLPEGEIAPPRPPPPEEEEMNLPKPHQSDEPIMKAAYELHVEAQKWSSRGNDLIAAAKKMALLMAEMSRHVRGQGESKKGLIDCAKAIAKASEEVTRLATEIAKQCTDKRMRMNLMQVCERIPTIATQLKIISTVKATLLGEPGSEDEEEATEVLIGNAQNLMQAVKETVRSAEAASIKIRTDAGQKLRWVRKSPWYS